MGGSESDVLARWLDAQGRATLDRITGGSPDVVGVMDPEFIIRYVNWTAPGLTRETVEGHSVFNLVPPGYADIAREAFEHVLSTGKPARFETMYRNELGVLIWMVRVGPVVHDGEVIGVFTINTDVTEERRGDADRDRFFSLSLDMLVVVTAEGRLKRLNPAFGAALGYAVDELIGMPFGELVHPDDVARSTQVFGAMLQGTSVNDFENRYRRRDGTYRVFSWRATVDPVTGDVYAVARDITEHRATEAQLLHAQKMEAIGQLAGGVAHDFNNLMQAVLAHVELALSAGAVPPSLTDHLRGIDEAGRRAAELTKQLLAFSRQQTLRRELIDLGELLKAMMKLLSRLLPEHIRIELRTDELPAVSADRTQLEQVVLNLCVNARDAMESGGTLTLETAVASLGAEDCTNHPWVQPGPFVRLTVSDTGAGMAAEVLGRIFDPFFTTKAQQRGTGLGLSTVYGIVQQHGGLMRVDSAVGVGTTFRVYLPADDRPTAERRALSDRPRTEGRGETILVAEDEPMVRSVVVQTLEGAGYRTLAACDGQQAVGMLREDPAAVDLVLLDVVMPELGGPQAWEQMQRVRAELPVIFVSGYADDRYRALLPADVEVIEKPFKTRELLQRIRAALDR